MRSQWEVKWWREPLTVALGVSVFAGGAFSVRLNLLVWVVQVQIPHPARRPDA